MTDKENPCPGCYGTGEVWVDVDGMEPDPRDPTGNTPMQAHREEPVSRPVCDGAARR